MVREVGGVGARVMALLVERWPITLAQVALALGLRRDVVEREARRLAAQRLIVLERLGEDVYVALSGEGARLVGLSPKDVERLRDRKPTPPPPRDENDPAFL